MENFVVSARKYRPLGFGEVVGQEHVTTTLENAIRSGHIGQALLFCGPRGVGKTTCARILAKAINGFETEDPEGIADFNIFELDAASNNSVEDIRNLIEQIRYPPQQGKYKVYIIDEVHMLSNQAFNAFLKTLEEPPKYVLFILATTEKHKVIPTILSRCQIYDFHRIEVRDIIKQLQKIAEKEGIEVEQDALHLIGQKADGALRDALSIFDLITTVSSDGKVTYQDTIKNLHILDYDYYIRLVNYLLEGKSSDALMLFDEITRTGFDGNHFLVGFQQHLRDLLVAQDSKTIALLDVSENLRSQYLHQSQKASPSFLLSALNLCHDFELHYKASKNHRLHIELCLLKLAHLTHTTQPTETSHAHENKKKEWTDSTSTPKSRDDISNYDTTKQNVNPARLNEQESVYQATNERPTALDRGNQPPTATQQPNLPKKRKETPSILKKRSEPVTLKKEVPTSVIDKRKEFFTEEQLQQAWRRFQSNRSDVDETEKRILYREVRKGQGDDIIIFLDSSLEARFLEKFEMKLIQYLRTELKNAFLTIKKQLPQQEKNKKPYTNKDVYQYMVRQNPTLQKLKEKLGLDFNY